MGVVVPAGQGQIPGRQAAIKGGVPHDVPCLTINKVCGSALKAVTLAAQMIKAGDAEIIVAGGMIMLRKAVKPKLLALFIAICTIGIIIVGYFFNAIQGFII